MVKNESSESRILAAARSEFCEFGLRGARMQAIADRCGVNKALVHYYFRSKERLYEAVLKDIVHTMRTAIDRHLDDDDAGADIRVLLRNIISVYIGTLRQYPDIARFMFREVAEGGTHLPSLISQVAPVVRELPLKISLRFAAEMDAGTIRRMPGVHLLLNILGMCVFTFAAQPIISAISRNLDLKIGFDDVFYEERIDTILEMVLRGIMTAP